MEHSNTLYHVPFELGERIEELSKHTTYPIKIVKVSESSSTIVLEKNPLIPIFKNGQHEFKLPPTILFSVFAQNGKIVNIITNPQLGLANIDEAINILKSLIIQFDAAGWQRVNSDSFFPKPDELRKVYEDRNVTKTGVQYWQLGHQKIILNIERTLTAQDIIDIAPAVNANNYKDKFLITLTISDFSIVDS